MPVWVVHACDEAGAALSLMPQTPNMAICDANLVDGMPKSLTAFGGLDALVHALESYVSVCATDYTKGEDLLVVLQRKPSLIQQPEVWCSTPSAWGAVAVGTELAIRVDDLPVFCASALQVCPCRPSR
jgi:alcohol dehydrogenase YqhD (iron-dependent ADH family)